ncbi:MAG: hypothetical protein HN544_05510 [Euryarchaeota archaeon]|mgnify:CR=1 FL=1|nr:hypothetical protein [Euryarchaeota archaeon]
MTENKEYNPWEHMKWELDLNCMEFILSAFESYNKFADSRWIWPEDIEEISSCLKLNGELDDSLKQKWIDFAKLVCNNDSITIINNTFTIIGKYSSKFSFDASIEFSRWLAPGSLGDHEIALANIQKKIMNKHILHNHIANLEASSASWKIETLCTDDGLGFQDFPTHMSNLELKQFEAYSTCIFPSGDTFIQSLVLLCELLIEDEEIWNILHKQEVSRRKWNEEFDKKWPNGRPDDWMYL